MADVPSRVIELVETFDRDIDTYHSSQYNETQLRREFIDPLFEQLGWDVANKAAHAHAYKDVIHEDAISVGSATKAPDYCFRIGGTRKFFLEAKKPSINIKGDPHPAYQLRRYAWSAKLPLSILTDFEEFAVYDSQIKPNQKDGAAVARIMYFTYKDYLHKWASIAEIFSKDAILKGSFDKFTASAKGKRGTTTVDVAFLAEIEKWRDMLAKIIALRNRNLSQPEINFAVQCTIDRILFLRMCEDRGIERYGQLQSISSGDRTYPRLCEVFEQADQKYNSGLFHFHDEPGRTTPPDTLTPSITIDDKDLKWILYNLYYPQCPYEFSVLPPEILGNVYEQFLGKVITLTPAHYAKIEDKPEVKKAGGVYYTPSYIVDYIVKNTVGNLLNDPAAPQPRLAPTPVVGGSPKPSEKPLATTVIPSEAPNVIPSAAPNVIPSAAPNVIPSEVEESIKTTAATRPQKPLAPTQGGSLKAEGLGDGAASCHSRESGNPPLIPGEAPTVIPSTRPTVIPSAVEESDVTGHCEEACPERSRMGGNLKPLTPKQIENIKILDPACGSGSFLLGAYTYLLDYHRDWYAANDPEKWTRKKTPPIYQVLSPPSFSRRRHGDAPSYAAPNYRLTIAEKKRILLNNIFGVDIDSQAVEVTKLSLLLKVLEGENSQTLENQHRLFHERALPDLASNIKCGNSLIAPDFFDNDVIPSAVEESNKTHHCEEARPEHRRRAKLGDGASQPRNTQSAIRNTNIDLYQKINPFDWKQEFPQIFSRKNPGFDAVIGNPPWGQKGVSFDENTNLYLRTKYTSVTGILDIFRPFVECGIMLTLSGGMFGMVLPDIILLKDYEETRKCILEDLSITRIDWWGMAFASAVIDTATIIGQKKPAPEDHLVTVRVHDFEHPLSHEIPQSDFRKNPRCVFNLFLTREKRQIWEELKNCPKLGDFFEVHEGVHSGNIRKELFIDQPVDDTCQQLLFGRDEIAPYHLKWNGRYIRHSILAQKKSKKFYANGGRPEWYAQDKVLVRRTGDFVLAALDSERRYASNNFFILFPKTPCSLSLAGLCAFLNSRFATWYFRTIEPRTGRVFAELKIKHLNVFPIPPSARDPNGCQALNELGTRRIQLARKAFEAKTPHEEDATHRICAHLDRKIDNLVAQLLGIEIPPELQSHQ